MKAQEEVLGAIKTKAWFTVETPRTRRQRREVGKEKEVLATSLRNLRVLGVSAVNAYWNSYGITF